MDAVRARAWNQLRTPPLPGEPSCYGQLETIDRTLGLVSNRGKGLGGEDHWALPVLMNPFSATKVRPETKEDEEVCVIYCCNIFSCWECEKKKDRVSMSHQLHFPKEF